MDLNRLRGFYTVVQQGGFTAAARRLRLSQPSISLQVKNLEQEMGLQLLERHPRGVTPTREGQVLYEMAEKLFTTEEEIDFTIGLLEHHVNRLREMSPLWELKQEGIDISTIKWSQDAH